MWDGQGGGTAVQVPAKQVGTVCTHFSSCSRGNVNPTIGDVASRHGVGAEMSAPAIAPLQPPKALECPTQPLGGKDDRATSGVS